MPWQRGSPTWRDELGPAYGFGQGAASPGFTVLTGSTHVRGLTFAPGDRVDVAVQFNHDVQIPPPGEFIELHPHVHFTFVDNPTAGNTVRWKFTFLGSKASTGGEAAFGTTPSTISSTRCVLSSTEIAKHYLKPLTVVNVPSTSWGNSYMWWGTLELSTLSTIASGKVALLAFDVHKLCRPAGAGSLGIYTD